MFTGFPKHWTTLKKLMFAVGSGIAGGASAIWKTVTGALIHITDALASPMQKCEVSLEPIQDLHGQDAPYPAGGGKNKFNVDAIPTNQYISVTNGNIVITLASSSTGKTLGELSDVVVGETYILTATTTSSANYIYLVTSASSWYFGTSRTITQDDINSRVIVYGAADTTTTISNFMIRLSSVADDTFAPYSNICPITGWTGCEVWVKDEYDPSLPATASVTFPNGQTVYGGKYEFVSGESIKTHNRLILKDLTWYAYQPLNNGGYRFVAYPFTSESVYPKEGVALTQNISNVFSYINPNHITADTPYYKFGVYSSGSNRFIQITHPAETVTDLITSLTELDAILVYEVANPTTNQLTPQEISTLKDENNVWSNTNSDTTIIYKAQAE